MQKWYCQAAESDTLRYNCQTRMIAKTLGSSTEVCTNIYHTEQALNVRESMWNNGQRRTRRMDSDVMGTRPIGQSCCTLAGPRLGLLISIALALGSLLILTSPRTAVAQDRCDSQIPVESNGINPGAKWEQPEPSDVLSASRYVSAHETTMAGPIVNGREIYVGAVTGACLALQTLRSRAQAPGHVHVYAALASISTLKSIQVAIDAHRMQLATAGVSINSIGVNLYSSNVSVTVSSSQSSAEMVLRKRYSPGRPELISVAHGNVTLVSGTAPRLILNAAGKGRPHDATGAEARATTPLTLVAGAILLVLATCLVLWKRRSHKQAPTGK